MFGASELGRFFVTRPTDAANKPSYFYCWVCWKVVSVLTHGQYELARHFIWSHHFARDQGLLLEKTWWRVLVFHGNPLSDDELERQRGKIENGPSEVRDCEHPFAKVLIADGAGFVDPELSVLTKVSCLVDALKMVSSYEHVKKL